MSAAMHRTLSGDRKRRLDELMAALTWPEKVAQLQIAFAIGPDARADVARSGIGAIFWPLSPAGSNAAQRVAVEETRLGIPLLIGLDVIHGHRTIFPTPLALASSFDPDLVEAAARIAAAEASSEGVTWTFSPMLDISRDARWGRSCEGFGEDPLLTGELGAATVRGYQGASLEDQGSILACAKHYVGSGAAEAGRDYNAVDMSEYRLRNTYLPPFRRVVDEGVATVMASFNTVAGRPVHANRHLLTEILKEEWGHAGVVVGDAEGVRNLIPHGVAADIAHAARMSLLAGLDVEMGGSLVADGRPILEPDDALVIRMDDAVRRLLTLKLAMGLFEHPYVDEAAAVVEPAEASLALARRAAERSAVLLKNEGGVLPVTPTAKRILLAGTYVESADHLGAWVQRTGAPASSLAHALRAALPFVEVVVLPGGSVERDDPDARAAAVAAAGDADLVILAVGEPSDLTGEASSRADIRLSGDQEALIQAMADTGTPVAVVLASGRPLVVSAWVDRVAAVLLVWHLGTEAAPAIANLLAGVANPAGRLPMAFPRSVGQLPMTYAHENAGRPPARGGTMAPKHFDVALDGPANLQEFYTSKYRDLELGPQFEFGHGLSYAAFEHRSPTLAPASVSSADLEAGTRLAVEVEIHNTSDRGGDEVVLVFVWDLVASLAQPVRRLASFQRVAIGSGETLQVRLEFGFDELAFWADDGKGWRVEPGDFEVFVGPRLDATSTLRLAVTG